MEIRDWSFKDKNKRHWAFDILFSCQQNPQDFEVSNISGPLFKSSETIQVVHFLGIVTFLKCLKTLTLQPYA